MLKMAKKLTAVAMTLIMSMGISLTAVAAQPAPQVQLNGQNLAFADAKPVMRQGSLYVPARALSDGIGAEITYDAATKITSITKDTTAVHFSVGNADISITKDGSTQVTKASAPSLNINNQIYVPIRFAEQVFGYTVGWDSEAQTAIIIDKNSLLDQLTGQFTLMNQYMAYSQSISKDNYAIKGTFKFNATAANEADGAIKMDGTIGGITNADVANMNMALKMDTEVLKKLIGTEAGKDEATATALLESLKEIKLDIIFNVNTGKYYISSSVFANPMLKTMGLDENTWYYFDLNQLFSEVGEDFSLDQLMTAAKSGSFETYVKSYLEIMPVDSVDSYKAIEESINVLKTLCSDSAFTKNGDNYTSQYHLRQDNTDMSLNLTLKGDKDNTINGCSIVLNLKQDGSDIIAMTLTQDQLNTKMSMNFAIPNVGSADLDLDMRMTKTTEKPLSAPPAGSKVVSINDALAADTTETTTLENTTTDETEPAAPVAETSTKPAA